MRPLAALALLSLLGTPAFAAAELSSVSRAEIDGLLSTLGSSSCQFYRNGSWHDGHAAEDHLRTKYEYLLKKGKVHTAEDFIEGAGTKSSLSGESYRVQCPNQPPQLSATWLGDRLKERRSIRQAAKP